MFRSRWLPNTCYRSAVYLFFLLTLLSLLLSVWLHTHYHVTPVATTLTPTQYMRLVRRGVTSPQLLSKAHNYTLTQSDAFCADVPSSSKPEPDFIFLMIVSSWENTERRDHIRNTWATYSWFHDTPTMTYSYKFVLSQPNPKLNYSTLPTDLDNDDIMMSDMNEHYYLLDMKVMWGFSAVLENHNFHYILKCDDDTFVNLYRLPPKLLGGGTGSEYLYGGHPLITHKWSGEGIPYAAGSGYVMSRKALCAVVFAHSVYSLETPRIPIEDAYTGLLNARMGITLRHFAGFATNHESCKDFTTVIFHHIHMKLFKKLLFAAVNGTHFC